MFQEAGAKVEFLFESCKLFLKFFFGNFYIPFPSKSTCQSLNELPVLRGAKVKTYFISGKLSDEKIFDLFYLTSCFQYLKNFAVIAGAKVAPFSACASFLLLFF